MGERFIPEPQMEEVLAAAKAYLYQGDTTLVALHTVDTTAWCKAAGCPPIYWESWLKTYGEPFLTWFGESLLPTELERYAMDALWWRNWRNVLTGDKASAAHLKAWGEMRGHFDDRPPPPPVRHLSSDEALQAIVALGVDVLEYAYQEAVKLEHVRRGQAPEKEDNGKEKEG